MGNMMLNWIKLIILCILSLSNIALSNDTKSKIITIGQIDGESDGKMSVVTIRFDKKPDFEIKDIQEHGSFIQVNIPNSIAPTSGEFYEGNSNIFRKIAVIQSSPETTSVRIFLGPEYTADAVKHALETEILNNRLVITIDHKSVSKTIASNVNNNKSAEKEPNIVTQKTLEEIEKATGVISTKKFDINEKLYTIGGFLAFLCILFILSFSLKPILDRKRRKRQGENYTPMKHLGDLAISAKQKLTLVQVGSEQILISVSPDNINFIHKIEQSKPKAQLPDNIREAFKSQQILSNQREKVQEISQPKQLETSKQLNQNKSAEAPRKGEFQSFMNNEETEKKNEPLHTAKKQSRINLKIDDDGIEDLRRTKKEDNSKSIEDVTKIIRDKLKNLPNF